MSGRAEKGGRGAEAPVNKIMKGLAPPEISVAVFEIL